MGNVDEYFTESLACSGVAPGRAYLNSDHINTRELPLVTYREAPGCVS